MHFIVLRVSQKLKKNNLKILISILFFILFDRITKNFFYTHFSQGQSTPFLGDLLRFTLVFNKGAAFGTMQEKSTFLIFISFLILSFLIVFLFKNKNEHPAMRTGITLIISGAAGNLYDRIIYGHVIDFIDVDIPDIISGFTRWPVFNIADSCITIGIIIIIIFTLFNRQEKPHESNNS